MNKISYRPDIDGLRAVAILAVLVNHAFPKLLRGGFRGGLPNAFAKRIQTTRPIRSDMSHLRGSSVHNKVLYLDRLLLP